MASPAYKAAMTLSERLRYLQRLSRPEMLLDRIRYAGTKPGDPNYGRGRYWSGASQKIPTPSLDVKPTQRPALGPEAPMVERFKVTPGMVEVRQGERSKMVRLRPEAVERRVRTTLPREPVAQAPSARPKAPRLGGGIRGAAPLLAAPILDYLMRIGESSAPGERVIRSRAKKMET